MESPNKRWKTLGVWLLAGILSAPLTIILHELGHYLAALAMGAEGVTLHFADVAYDETSVSLAQGSVVSVMGPVTTYLIILGCFLLTRKQFNLYVVTAAIVAPLRGLAGLGFVIFSLRGITDRAFSGVDEWEFATKAGITPWIPILIALTVLGLSWFYFFREIKRKQGGWYILLAVGVIVIGLIVYFNVLGPVFFPGGRTFS